MRITLTTGKKVARLINIGLHTKEPIAKIGIVEQYTAKLLII